MSARLDPNTIPLRNRNLASADLPRRVRAALERLYALASDNFGRQLESMLSDFEQQLFRLAEQARNPALQSGYFETLRKVRLHRAALTPRFMAGLETGLAAIREPATGPSGVEEPVVHDELRLVDDAEVSEASVLTSIASRHESRAGLPLLLLGQRFGVLAGAPAFDAEHLPVGPHRLCRLLADASEVLQLEQDSRLLLFQSFNAHAMSGYAQLVEAMNALLARENILPGLSYVPLRTRPTAQDGDEDAGTAHGGREHDGKGHDGREHGEATAHGAARDASAPRGRTGDDGTRPFPERPHTRWWGENGDDATVEDENVALSALQALLAGRRETLGKLRKAPDTRDQVPLKTPDVVAALGAQQNLAPADSPQRPRTIADLKQALLAQSRQQHGQAMRLSSEDEDTFELLGLLYTEIGRELREGTLSSSLLERLQVPLLRLALLDRAFFVRAHHPARQLLGAIAEAGAKWLGDDEDDPRLERQLREAVDHVVQNYQGDAEVFEAANRPLQHHLQLMARKAELSERRHVEAARGKEKLVVARRRSGETIEQALAGRDLPRFLRKLLDQAWADVLTLTLLRHGEDSQEWRHYAEMTTLLAATGIGSQASPEGLDRQVEHALAQVGYHEEEAAQIARHLTSGRDDGTGRDADPASRTELAMKLKTRARLGDEANTPKSRPLAPRNPREQACYEHLRTLPFGTWMEFVLNQQGDVVRRRIAWFSTVTDRMLFVNQRGQRVDEQSLDHVSRLMAQNQVRVVTADRGRLIDRAWHAALNALRNFAGMPDQLQGATP
ncbi:DUF1631 family protein [Marilutibacter chinensis]|uniref:DUF1631 domain-containing protein n=1 Tax=Marilutibacter chinensis TaxID=2912247 RepID=A0ABS9HYB6_9GAMM|nr:DUF1631 family protein [Lysobacter chinensis]MCF7223836.1 DUF1631 domain-containing protein [Lysobacter chinensis]